MVYNVVASVYSYERKAYMYVYTYYTKTVDLKNYYSFVSIFRIVVALYEINGS